MTEDVRLEGVQKLKRTRKAVDSLECSTCRRKVRQDRKDRRPRKCLLLDMCNWRNGIRATCRALRKLGLDVRSKHSTPSTFDVWFKWLSFRCDTLMTIVCETYLRSNKSRFKLVLELHLRIFITKSGHFIVHNLIRGKTRSVAG